MSKHINTHLFFHMNADSSKNKGGSSGGGGIGGESSGAARKPKKSSNLFSGYEIDTNPPLPSETGDYYDYYTNYGIPDVFGPTSPGASPPYYSAGATNAANATASNEADQYTSYHYDYR